jgi:hypothetical protein
MRLLILLSTLLVSGCAATSHYATEHHDSELGGRSVGASQRCIPEQPHEGFRVADFDRHILLYGSGKTVWVTRLEGLCGFSHDDQLISDAWNSQYCSGQLVRSPDLSRGEGSSCVIGEFTPYTRGPG